MSDDASAIDRKSARRVALTAAIGNAIEVYDVFVYGYFATVLAKLFFPSWDSTAALLATFAIFAVGFFVRPIGGIIFGHIGDRFGRRAALSFSLSLMTVATVALGLLPTYANVGVLAPVLLLLCRILQGLSVSAEIPGAVLLILEHAQPGRRGRAVSINNAAANIGSAVAAAVGLTLARLLTTDQLTSWGWRVACLLAAPIGLVGLYVRLRLTDTPAFTALGDLARCGRAPLHRALATAKQPMLVFLTWMAVTAPAGYMVVGFLPTYLIRDIGLSQANALTATFVALLSQAAAAPLGGYLADRFPLHRVAIGLLAGLAVVPVPVLLFINEYRTVGAALLGQSLWALLVGATYSTGTVLSVTLFPVAIRFTATAIALNLGFSVFGSTAPYVSTWLIAATGHPVAPGVYLSALAVIGFLVAVRGVPRRQRPEDADREASPSPASPARGT